MPLAGFSAPRGGLIDGSGPEYLRGGDDDRPAYKQCLRDNNPLGSAKGSCSRGDGTVEHHSGRRRFNFRRRDQGKDVYEK